MRVIVRDVGVGVNGYADFGKRPPLDRPAQCPACEAPNSLWSHGVRARGVWRAGVAVAIVIYVWRLRCREPGCRATFTVLPSFLHPLKRYLLEQVEAAVVPRFVEPCSYRDLERRVPHTPSASTQRDWCRGFAASAERWLEELTTWLARINPAMVLVRRAEVGDAAGLLAMALQSADWVDEFSARRGSPRNRLLEHLWLWGAERVAQPLLASTRCRAGPR